MAPSLPWILPRRQDFLDRGLLIHFVILKSEQGIEEWAHVAILRAEGPLPQGRQELQTLGWVVTLAQIRRTRAVRAQARCTIVPPKTSSSFPSTHDADDVVPRRSARIVDGAACRPLACHENREGFDTAL